MSNCKENKEKSCCLKQNGNAAVAVLVVLLVVAVALAAYLVGKKGGDSAGNSERVASSTKGGESSVLAQGAAAENPVLAKFDGEEVRRQEVIDLVNSMPPQMQQIPLEQLFPMALEQLINNKLIDKRAANADLDDDSEVQEKLAQAKEQIIRSTFVEREVNKKVTEERIKEKYDAFVKNFPDQEEIKAAHILVEDEKTAKDIIKKLNKGGDFAELAKENSKDGTAENGGLLGYFVKADVVPEFSEAAFATKVGEYTKKPVKTNFGFHIIKVEDKRKRQPPAFENQRPFLEQELRRAALEETIKSFREDVEIDRFDINGNPLNAQEPSAGEVSETAPEAGESVAEAETAEGADAVEQDPAVTGVQEAE